MESSDEYLHAAQTFSLSKDQLFNISSSTIEHSFAEEEIKEDLRKHWKDWKTKNNELFES